MPSGYTLDFSQIQMTDLPHSCSSCPSSLMTRLSGDCCLAAEKLMLAARDAGIGTCWIGL
jgi:nitroreductase